MEVRARLAGLVAGGLVVVGCASPGPPRPPTLQLPQPARDLSAQREGDRVALKFTLPQHTTDGLPIREGSVQATVCRGEGEGQPCVPVSALQNVGVALSATATAAERVVTWHDDLPTTEASGEPRLLVYRVKLSNLEGKTAGWSDAAYAVAGAAPSAVSGLSAEETRAGILLRWQGGADADRYEVLLRRELVSPPAKAKQEETAPVWLQTHAKGDAQTIDATADEDVAYRYAAVRRRVVTLGQRKLELRSAESAPVVITWRNAFPPAAPLGLSAAPFGEGEAFAVDLVWEPVQEPGLKGYLVTRQADGDGVETLTSQPVALPAFHDASAKPGVRYTYVVRAVSAKGIQGAVATVVVGP